MSRSMKKSAPTRTEFVHHAITDMPAPAPLAMPIQSLRPVRGTFLEMTIGLLGFRVRPV